MPLFIVFARGITSGSYNMALIMDIMGKDHGEG